MSVCEHKQLIALQCFIPTTSGTSGSLGVDFPKREHRGSVMPTDDRRGSMMPTDGRRGSMMPTDDRRGSMMPTDGRRGPMMPTDGRKGSVMPTDGRKGSVMPTDDRTPLDMPNVPRGTRDYVSPTRGKEFYKTRDLRKAVVMPVKGRRRTFAEKDAAIIAARFGNTEVKSPESGSDKSLVLQVVDNANMAAFDPPVPSQAPSDPSVLPSAPPVSYQEPSNPPVSSEESSDPPVPSQAASAPPPSMAQTSQAAGKGGSIYVNKSLANPYQDSAKMPSRHKVGTTHTSADQPKVQATKTGETHAGLKQASAAIGSQAKTAASSLPKPDAASPTKTAASSQPKPTTASEAPIKPTPASNPNNQKDKEA